MLREDSYQKGVRHSSCRALNAGPQSLTVLNREESSTEKFPFIHWFIHYATNLFFFFWVFIISQVQCQEPGIRHSAFCQVFILESMEGTNDRTISTESKWSGEGYFEWKGTDIMEGFPEEVTSETSRVLKEGTRDQCSRKSKVRVVIPEMWGVLLKPKQRIWFFFAASSSVLRLSICSLISSMLQLLIGAFLWYCIPKSLSSQYWCLLIIFSHSSWDFSGSWYYEWF